VSVMGVSAEVGESDSARRVLREGAILVPILPTPRNLLTFPRAEVGRVSTIRVSIDFSGERNRGR
jgi:hypothetical protein